MSRHHCERIWQAEAREDGRLDKRDLASFERHAAVCPDCTKEIDDLQGITRKMALLPDSARTDLEHRRARHDLLRRANEEFLAAKPKPKLWRPWVLAGAVVLLLSGIIWQRTGQETLRSPTFDVVDVTNAIWQTETIASTSRVALHSGTAAFHVEHLEGTERFLVDMPDGHIEVRGTRFVVEVVEGITRSVEVTEGTVFLDIAPFHGLLRAGERWPNAERAQAAATNRGAAPRSTAPNQNVESNDALAADAGPPIAPIPAIKNNQEPAVAPIVSSERPDDAPPAANSAAMPKNEAGSRFAEAMAAFTAGDDTRADQLFAAFVRNFPFDGRAEDATFLRAKARARHGDSAGAAAIAREYLKAFPRGFRRPEAERLAGEGK